MENKRPSVYEECRQKGISRRDFLKFCTTMAALMGLEASGVAQVVNALETKPRLPIIWLHLQECTCCTESFIRAAHPIVATLLLDKISLDYTETLMAAAGEQAEAAKEETMKKYYGNYLLMIEGSLPTKDEAYCCVGGKSALRSPKRPPQELKRSSLGATALPPVACKRRTRILPALKVFIKSSKVNLLLMYKAVLRSPT